MNKSRGTSGCPNVFYIKCNFSPNFKSAKSIFNSTGLLNIGKVGDHPIYQNAHMQLYFKSGCNGTLDWIMRFMSTRTKIWFKRNYAYDTDHNSKIKIQ